MNKIARGPRAAWPFASSSSPSSDCQGTPGSIWCRKWKSEVWSVFLFQGGFLGTGFWWHTVSFNSWNSLITELWFNPSNSLIDLISTALTGWSGFVVMSHNLTHNWVDLIRYCGDFTHKSAIKKWLHITSPQLLKPRHAVSKRRMGYFPIQGWPLGTQLGRKSSKINWVDSFDSQLKKNRRWKSPQKFFFLNLGIFGVRDVFRRTF